MNRTPRLNRRRFKQFFLARTSPRLQMLVLLLVLTFFGIVANKIFYVAGIEAIGQRHALTILFCYGMFFALTRLWLGILLSPHREAISGGDSPDLLDLTDPLSGENRTPQFVGQGGRSGGGGANASWTHTPSKSGSPSSFEFPDVAASADDGIGILLILIVAVVFILLAGTLLIYDAPVILSEAAFEIWFAGAVLKRVQKLRKQPRSSRETARGFALTILKTTWKPALAILLVAWISGMLVSAKCPGATRWRDALHACHAQSH